MRDRGDFSLLGVSPRLDDVVRPEFAEVQGNGHQNRHPSDPRGAPGTRQGGACRGAAQLACRVRARWRRGRDPVALLEEQAVTRVPELVPIRYGRMLVSPFTFYRGAALIMAADLARTPASGLTAQVCGDAHLSNFGVFASPERDLVFDINDFDETLPGPWEWDVKRLAASFAVAGRENGFRRSRRAARSCSPPSPATARRCASSRR